MIELFLCVGICLALRLYGRVEPLVSQQQAKQLSLAHSFNSLCTLRNATKHSLAVAESFKFLLDR